MKAKISKLIALILITFFSLGVGALNAFELNIPKKKDKSELNTNANSQIQPDIVDTLYDKIFSCWKPAHMNSMTTTLVNPHRIKGINVKLQIFLNPDGTVNKIEHINRSEMSKIFESTGNPNRYQNWKNNIIRTAKSAVNKCQPYNLFPKEYYEAWKVITVYLDPIERLKGKEKITNETITAKQELFKKLLDIDEEKEEPKLVVKKEPKISVANTQSEKVVTWQAYVKLESYGGLNTTLPSFTYKETSKIKYNTKDQYKLFSKVTKKAMQKCKDNELSKGFKCLFSVIKYFEPNNPTKNQKLVNKTGIKIKDVKVNWDGIDSKETKIPEENYSAKNDATNKTILKEGEKIKDNTYKGKETKVPEENYSAKNDATIKTILKEYEENKDNSYNQTIKEISQEEKDFILKYQQKIKNKTKIYKKDDNHIIALTPPVGGGKILLDFLAASHCAEYNKFAFRFKDSGKTRIYYNQIEAYHYRCSANIILKNSLSNSKVVWTNYDDKSFYKYPEKHLFLYRKKTKTFDKILKAAKKKDPSLFKPQLYRIYYKDKNTINISGKKMSHNVPARKIAADHCAKYNKNVYYFEDDFYSGVKASMLFYCANKTFLSNPRTGKAVRFTNDSKYFIKLKASQQSMYKEEFEKYGAKSLISYYFFEASNDYLSALELLYRAYDLNVRADEYKAQIEYNKNSKYSESQKLKSTSSLVDKGSIEIESKLNNESLLLSEEGRKYYGQSMPYAFSAYKNSALILITANNVREDIKSSGKKGFLGNIGEIFGILKILPDLNSFIQNMRSTIKLVIGGAKEKKVKDKGNLNKALNELNLDS